MKQICIARNNDDVATLLGQCERVMGALRANPDTEQVYTNTHMDGVTGLDVLSSPTEIDIHTGENTAYTVTLQPDGSRSIDRQVADALQAQQPAGNDRVLSQSPGSKKDITR